MNDNELLESMGIEPGNSVTDTWLQCPSNHQYDYKIQKYEEQLHKIYQTIVASNLESVQPIDQLICKDGYIVVICKAVMDYSIDQIRDKGQIDEMDYTLLNERAKELMASASQKVGSQLQAEAKDIYVNDKKTQMIIRVSAVSDAMSTIIPSTIEKDKEKKIKVEKTKVRDSKYEDRNDRPNNGITIALWVAVILMLVASTGLLTLSYVQYKEVQMIKEDVSSLIESGEALVDSKQGEVDSGHQVMAEERVDVEQNEVIQPTMPEVINDGEVVKFEDPALEAAIKAMFDIDEMEPLRTNTLNSITELVIWGNDVIVSGPIYEYGIDSIGDDNMGQIDGYFENDELTAIDRGGIVSLADLAHMPNLRAVQIVKQQITDISGLASFDELIDVSLMDNYISDVSPLANLKVESLNLHTNNISDISKLETALDSMAFISVEYNQISDISVLEGEDEQLIVLVAYNNIEQVSDEVYAMYFEGYQETIEGNPINEE